MPVPPASTVADPFEIPNPFGRYKLLRKIGQGGMGSVYLAEDSLLRRKVALKVPRDLDGDMVARFYREAQLLAGFAHPNICRVFDVGQIDGHHFLTMEYLEGRTLDVALNPSRPMKPAQAAKIVRKLAQALQKAHERGIVHRDLKPSNIMITNQRDLVILDFGLACQVDPSRTRLTQTGQLMGTPAYMAPEQVRADPQAIGPACDIYSLGVMLYEMLAGRRPFNGPITSLFALIVKEPPEPPSRFQPELDPRLEAICLEALAKAPTDRHASMAAFAAALGDWLAAQDPSDTATGELALVSATQIASQPPRRSWLRPVSALAVVALTTVGTVYFLQADPTPGPVANLAKTPAPAATPTPTPTPTPAPVVPAGKKVAPPSSARIVNDVGMTLVRIEPGRFTMGTSKDEVGRLLRLFPAASPSHFEDEQPAHEVRITKPFYLSAHEVTVGQFRRFAEATGHRTEAEVDGKGGGMPDARSRKYKKKAMTSWRAPGFTQTDDHPVVMVTWNDAKAFCQWLTRTDGQRLGLTYRLPTEAEWEYAARAGDPTWFHQSDDPENLAKVGNVGDAGLRKLHPNMASIASDDGFTHTSPVGSHAPNAWGLFDMIGNVWEWCEDLYAPHYYDGSPVADPSGPAPTTPNVLSRVVRGGCWDTQPRRCRPASRMGNLPGNRAGIQGFRIAASPTR